MRYSILILLVGVCSAQASQPLVCDVKGSDDRFLLYPEQQIYRSKSYDVYALMGGLTLATVSRQSLKFLRITQLSLLPQPDRLQLFEGQCHPASNTD
ncbi:hypothetical protein [Motiliproteus coralliicola]|uniref:hypothetical protein n=1 Tax=Motiliproteus coralliicola TaxID=2283196 RepID=UPI0010591010|nr:hypothetical protein [Motiliproteus coralliicola]